MIITRRGFLTSMLALGAAPAIVRAESLMRLWVPPQKLWIGYDLAALPDELTYYAIKHPSLMEEMVRKQLFTGTGFGHIKVLYRGEVGRYD